MLFICRHFVGHGSPSSKVYLLLTRKWQNLMLLLLVWSTVTSDTYGFLAQDYTNQRIFLCTKGWYTQFSSSSPPFNPRNTIGISMLLLVKARTKIVQFRMLRTFFSPSIDASGMKDLGGPILVNGVECRHLSGPLCNNHRCESVDLYVGFSSGIPVRIRRTIPVRTMD
jgi:hypothetical protein